MDGSAGLGCRVLGLAAGALAQPDRDGRARSEPQPSPILTIPRQRRTAQGDLRHRPEMPGAWQLTAREVASVAVYVQSLRRIPPELLPGDAERGARVYDAKRCAGCHMIGGKGEDLGPELAGIGAIRDPDDLPHVPMPNRAAHSPAVIPSVTPANLIRRIPAPTAPPTLLRNPRSMPRRQPPGSPSADSPPPPATR